jgi:hypothetical protein
MSAFGSVGVTVDQFAIPVGTPRASTEPSEIVLTAAGAAAWGTVASARVLVNPNTVTNIRMKETSVNRPMRSMGVAFRG